MKPSSSAQVLALCHFYVSSFIGAIAQVDTRRKSNDLNNPAMSLPYLARRDVRKLSTTTCPANSMNSTGPPHFTIVLGLKIEPAFYHYSNKL